MMAGILRRSRLALAVHSNIFKPLGVLSVQCDINNRSLGLDVNARTKQCVTKIPPLPINSGNVVNIVVFISYGPHDNLTLCLEYGFIVPGNPHDFVSISKEEICKHIGVKYSAPNTNFMCTTEGLSWDGKCQIAACLRISKNDIYSNEEIICAEKKIIKTKISFLNQELSLVNVTDVSSESYSVIKLLLEEHIQILKSALV